MNVGELIDILSKYPRDMRVQLRDNIGDWSVYITAQNIGMFMYVHGGAHADVCHTCDDIDGLKSLARRESQ